ncbi:hypothetical protein AYI68_g8217, partial [Smittium mucronatum]
MIILDHELVDSSAYPYVVSQEFIAWGGVVDGRDSDISTSISTKSPELGDGLDSPVNFTGES